MVYCLLCLCFLSKVLGIVFMGVFVVGVVLMVEFFLIFMLVMEFFFCNKFNNIGFYVGRGSEGKECC